MHCFILAGGFATRLWPLTERRAKPLLPLRGKPILSSIVEAVPLAIPITVSTNAVFADDMRTWATRMRDRSISIMVEDTAKDDHKLGAIGAVAKWIEDEKIDDDILLLAGDNYCECNMQAFINAFDAHPLLAAHDIQDLEQAKQFGTVILGEAKEGSSVRPILAFEEKPQEPKSTCVSAGWWILPRSTLPIVQEYAVTHPDNVGGIFEEFLRRSLPVECVVFEETWKDIGSFESYMAIHKKVVGENQLVDRQASVQESALEGSIVLGPGTQVRKSTLRDCMLFGDSIIENCILEGCIIDTDCVLKNIDLQGKMLRAGTRLEAEL